MRKFTTIVFCTFIFSVFAGQSLWAQQAPRCATDEMYQQALAENPALAAHAQQLEKEYQEYIQLPSAQKTDAAVRTIPVVVHVIQTSSNVQISDARIQSQIDVLNEDFRRMNSDASNTPSEFLPFAVDSEIEFCLASIDPNGCPTDGIVRIVSPGLASHNTGDASQLKALSQWSPFKYLNLWVPANIQGGILGYATFPTQLTFAPQLDGVVVSGTYFGRGNGTPPSAFNQGRTTTHEVGHWLGLFHTFQGGCSGSSASNCASQGDNICDTPPTSSPNYNCPGTQNTCVESPTDLNDQTMNYMDYVNDACMNLFTQGQKDRMDLFLGNARNQIHSAANLTATGCDGSQSPGCAPQADFRADVLTGCVGAAINFSDLSIGPPTSWSWSFTGGTPATDTTANPTVTYSAAGTYQVSLTVTNAAGTDTETKNGYISIVDPSDPPLVESFEGILFYPQNWYAVDEDNVGTWELFTQASTDGQNSMRVPIYDLSSSGTEDDLISEPFTLENMGAAEVEFDYAYKRRNAFTIDTMRIFVSSDCGSTWNLEWEKFSSGLATVGGFALSSGFVPAAGEWATDTIDLTAYLGSPAVRMKFQTIGYNGQNIYLDRINMSALLSAPGTVDNAWSISISPNPFNDAPAIQYTLAKGAQTHFRLMDVNGKVLYETTTGKQARGNHSLAIPAHVYDALGAGIYLLQGSNAHGKVTRKLMKMN